MIGLNRLLIGFHSLCERLLIMFYQVWRGFNHFEQVLIGFEWVLTCCWKVLLGVESVLNRLFNSCVIALNGCLKVLNEFEYVVDRFWTGVNRSYLSTTFDTCLTLFYKFVTLCCVVLCCLVGNYRIWIKLLLGLN